MSLKKNFVDLLKVIFYTSFMAFPDPNNNQKKKIGWKILRVILYIFLFLFILWLLLVIFNAFTGGGTSYLSTFTQISLEKIELPFKSILAPVIRFTQDPIGTVQNYGRFAPPKVQDSTKKRGVEISSFQSRKSFFTPQEDIALTAKVKVYALDESSSMVKFACLLENEAGETVVGISGTDEILMLPKQDKTTQVTCKFKPQQITERRELKKVTLIAAYSDFIVNSNQKVYLLSKEKLDEIESENKNPFVYYKISDPLLKSNNIIRSQQETQSPMKLILSIPISQPLTENSLPSLGIKLVNDKLIWDGKLDTLKSLRLIFPDNIKREEGGCHSFDENLNLGFSEIQKINTKEELIDLDNLEFWCDFKVEDLPQDMAFTIIKAQAQFDYSFKALTTVQIQKQIGAVEESLESKEKTATV